ncbi:MAG: peptide deformylase [Spirochaetaceae bacterium]|jgi:peptide deformylase|nr:peptide deformylase [Spirochaetaceae bacterium]
MDIYNAGVEEELAVLRKTAIPVTEFNDELFSLIDMMIEAMKENKGIGLAAPQVGDNRRVFVCSISDQEPKVFINPEIIETSMETSVYEEGCLSLPGMYADVERPERIRVQAWNRKGRPFKVEADDLLATCIQHEIDHLNGILFVDYLPEKKKEKILKKLERVKVKK